LRLRDDQDVLLESLDEESFADLELGAIAEREVKSGRIGGLAGSASQSALALLPRARRPWSRT
jgi:hypothetical protein